MSDEVRAPRADRPPMTDAEQLRPIRAQLRRAHDPAQALPSRARPVVTRPLSRDESPTEHAPLLPITDGSGSVMECDR